MSRLIPPKRWIVLLAAAFLLPSLSTAAAPPAAPAQDTAQPWIDLLEQPLETPTPGPNAWKHFSSDPQKELSDVWRLENGILICGGAPQGYLYLDRPIADFTLTLEWRWPEGKKPGSAGVLFRISGPDKIWPRSLEAQLNHGQAGDFWGLDGYTLDGPAERKKTAQNPLFGTLTNLKRAADLERPVGQWNSYEIVAEGPVVTLRINGQEVNKATGCDVAPGRICLTAEGDEIHFRNIRLLVEPSQQPQPTTSTTTTTAPSSARRAAAGLRAGAAAVDITPALFPLNMPGGFSANIADKAHDPLHARALVLADDKTTLALVVVDTLGVGRETADEAKNLASSQCGIPPEKILISATHSHSAPPSGATEGASEAVAYHKRLVQGIVEAITQAHESLRSAALGAAAKPLPEEVFNRRWFLKPGQMQPNPFGEMDQVKMNPGTSEEVLDRPAGPTDPDITILSIRDARSRKPLALLANYSLHYVGGIPAASVSADYYGEFARLVPTRINAPEGFVAMMSNGTSGDVNNIPFRTPRPPREPFEQVRIVAQKTADTAYFAWKSIEDYQEQPILAMLQREVTLQTRRPTPAQIEWAKGVLAIKDEAERAKLPRLADAYARRTLNLAGESETVNVLIQAIRIGDFAICTFPFETFAEIGLDLKKRSPFPRTMVISIANGSYGYLPTPRQHELGGYETWLGTNRVQKDASVILTDNLLEMLAELAKQ